jgi:hypothetical protein
MDETERSPPRAERRAKIDNNQLWASSQFQIIDLEARRQARAAVKRAGSYQQALCAQRYRRAGPVRFVVGLVCILLVAEHWSRRGWWILDYFQLVSDRDQSLLLVARDLETVGYPNRDRVQAKLAPARYSPAGREDREANEAMARLARRGFETSTQVVGIVDPDFIRFADGPMR